MKFFLDTADIDAIRELVPTGLVDGVTTNPSLAAKCGRPFLDNIRDICAAVDGPVSAEVAALEVDGMLAEGRILAALADNVTVKLPLTEAGLTACRALSAEGVKINMTLVFSAGQALLAAKAGATFVSPFVGRLDDIGADGLALIADIRAIFDNFPALETEILAASIRGPQHVVDCAKAGADVATLPPKVVRQLMAHPLTDKGLDAFMDDWKACGQTIL